MGIISHEFLLQTFNGYMSLVLKNFSIESTNKGDDFQLTFKKLHFSFTKCNSQAYKNLNIQWSLE